MTNVLPDPGEATINLAAYRLRHSSEIRSTIYGPNPAGETLIIDHRDGTFYRYSAPTFTPMGHGPDAWVFDVTGELQEPPTGPVPPLPPPPPDPQPTGMRPEDFRPAHRRRLAPLVKGVLIGAGVVAAVYSGLIAAAWVVLP